MRQTRPPGQYHRVEMIARRGGIAVGAGGTDGPGTITAPNEMGRQETRCNTHSRSLSFRSVSPRLRFVQRSRHRPPSWPGRRDRPPCCWPSTARASSAQTPGTRTDGWQEALDFCVREARDLTVKGGFGGRKPIYHIRDTIRFAALGLVAEHNDFLLEEWRRIHG